jgi:hypothetical protein
MRYAYSPATGELINTEESPADWMGTTTIAPPPHNPTKEGCFWRGSEWEVVAAEAKAEAVPTLVSMRQARRVLREAGLFGAIESAIDALPSPEKEDAKIDWEFSQEVRRDNALLQNLSKALGMTSTQMDALFIAASKL